MEYLTILLYLSPLILFVYIYINRKYSHWSDRGIKGPSSIYPFGYVLGRFLHEPIDFELDLLKKYGKVYGVYNGTVPTLSISDVELIKNVLVKDFHLFVNRRQFNVLDKYWSKNLFFAHDEDWKRIRSITTPAFTSGKLRRMFPLLKQSIDKLEKYLKGVSKDSNNSIDAKQIIAGFTIDVIASTSFGTDTDTNGDRSKFNPFLHHGQRMFQKLSFARLIMILTLPTFLLKLFKIEHAFVYDSFEFLINVIRTMLQRGGRREDLITLLKEAHVRDEDLKNMNFDKLTASSELEQHHDKKADSHASSKQDKFLTEEEIVAQCILFFIAGFETTASAITHTLYQLALNQDIQERLYEEVNEKLADIDPNNLDEYFETITNKIPYLDAVIKETLRLYPPVTRLERRLSAETYTLGGIVLEKDHIVEISTVAVHYDSDNYPNPTQYSPDRFLPENKSKHVPYSYIPFGDGPRNCVGMRFAYQEAKICLASLVQKFRFGANDKTPSELHFPKRFGILIANPFEISIESRE